MWKWSWLVEKARWKRKKDFIGLKMYGWCGYCKIVKTRLAPVRLCLRRVIFLMRVAGCVKVNRVLGGRWVVWLTLISVCDGDSNQLKWRDKLSWKERQKQRRRQTNRCTEAEERLDSVHMNYGLLLAQRTSGHDYICTLNQSIRQSFLTSVNSSTKRQNIFFSDSSV